jgi:hypothetical protein
MNVDTKLREASESVRQARREVKFSSRSPSRRGRSKPGPVVAVLAGMALVISIGVPAMLTTPGNDGVGDAEQSESNGSLPGQSVSATSVDDWVEPSISGGQLEEGGPVPPELRAYWALVGTLESVGTEPQWLCPPHPNRGYSFILDAAEVPPELAFELSGHSPVSSGTRDMGPTCEQTPALVLLAWTDQSELEATAGASVWASLTRFEDACPPGSCSFEGRTDHSDGLTVNGRPARLFEYQGTHELWWVDSDGVPLHGVFSGLSTDEVVSLASEIGVDPDTHLADTPTNLVAGLEVVKREPSVGVWTPTVSHDKTYEIDGTSVHVSARLADALGDASTPYTRFTSNVYFPDLIDLDETVGLWIPEGGNYLLFETDKGVKAAVEGAADKDAAVTIAQSLVFP